MCRYCNSQLTKLLAPWNSAVNIVTCENGHQQEVISSPHNKELFEKWNAELIRIAKEIDQSRGIHGRPSRPLLGTGCTTRLFEEKCIGDKHLKGGYLRRR